ncbi:YtxH domain-containing protein [Winogradskyella algicola]|jgi:gas vesicle protein|uniref:YtxH domain-containing protein n=1 Tax=Winogradskyella algicola TaxID=2575815 RepID=UPI001107E2A2|nr:YtxH domain-containing protein [Winogradskyella algicola]
MKRLSYLFLALFSLSVFITSCREQKTPDEKVEHALDEVSDELEEASDDVKDAAEDLKDEIEEVKEENGGK